MSAPGSATAADVPAKYDLVINGFGYCLLDSLESSIPFRTHRAIYGQTQPFVERQNVSNSYGDNAQDFFLTVRQRDWSLGEQQKFFRSGQDGRYWMGQNVDVVTPGQVVLSSKVASLTAFPRAASGGCRSALSVSLTAVTDTTHLWTVAADGTETDAGAHGLGAPPNRFGVCSDGYNVFMTTTVSGTLGVRYFQSPTTFGTFSSTAADSLVFLNNTLYGLNGTTQTLIQYDSSGTATTLFTWKTAGAGSGSTFIGDVTTQKLEQYGGKLLILLGYGPDVGGELWIYDGSGISRLEVFPSNFFAYDLEVHYGIAYISGAFMRPASSSTVYAKPCVLFYDGSQIGKLWEASAYGTTAISIGSAGAGDIYSIGHPALGVVDGRLIFTDDTTGNLMAYNPSLGGISTIGTYTVAGSAPRLITSGTHVVHTRNQTAAYLYPDVSFPSSGYVVSSLIDFDSSLKKQFRGMTVEWDAASDGNGGSVDIAYQTDSLTGSWTTLKTGAVSGTEYILSSVSGHAIAAKVTINKGTSTAGPTLRTLSVRGAPQMPVYPRGEYIIDCTGNQVAPRELRDGTDHPLTGEEQVQNLLTARNSASPISITDKINGTFDAFVDVNDPEGFDVYEEHPDPDNPKKAGSYVVRLTVRGV